MSPFQILPEQIFKKDANVVEADIVGVDCGLLGPDVETASEHRVVLQEEKVENLHIANMDTNSKTTDNLQWPERLKYFSGYSWSDNEEEGPQAGRSSYTRRRS